MISLRMKLFLHAVKNAKDNGTALHLFGLLSDGGVHSHITHLFGLLELAKREGLENVYVHCFLDGRDTPPQSGKGYVQELTDKLAELGVGKIATVMGRYYAMDRDNRWDRVERAYNALTKANGYSGREWCAAVQDSYNNGKNDEFVEPAVVMERRKTGSDHRGW